MKDWGKLLTAMVTPFDASGAVNLAEARRIAAYLVDEQANDGIVVSGTTAESPTLSETEKFALLEAILDEVGDRAAVVFGSGTNDTAESIELTKKAAAAGAHGIMLVVPYYSRPSQEGIYQHFKVCCEATDLPVMLYNIQARSAVNFDVAGMVRASHIPNMIAVKEASGNVAQISNVIGATTDFRVYSGDDGLTLPILALGGFGLISVAAHVLGKEFKEMIQCFESNPARAREIHHQIAPAVACLFENPNPVPVKYALSLRGFDCEAVRLPNVQLNDADKAKIKRLLLA